jgi:hypothetical protein
VLGFPQLPRHKARITDPEKRETLDTTRFVPGLVGAALFLALLVNVITKRNMCHDTGHSFEAAPIANMLRD